ncbi:MAG TPA: BrnT family toxin [Bryobacteraceae bacterium]|nr:BrnT family toxin [Bryobacteraceae bacterium]
MRRFEWGEVKNGRNTAKHGVAFETARLALEGPFCVSFVERIDDGEQRWHAIGMIDDIITIVVVHTYRV